ncbi:MAG TPA: hypothetical protein VFL59_08065 [Candidatus Nanopelagicales bacterium]|nr:hypothetical protein [Candidatus Nanopelagicales bacterium]
MKRIAVLSVLAAGLLAAGPLSACGSTSGSSGSATPTTSSSTPTPSVSTIASCDELKVAAAHLPTFLHYVALNIGTDNDSSSYFAEMRDTVASLEASTSVCSVDTTAQIAALRDGLAVLSAAYQPGAGAQQQAGDHAAIAVFAAIGVRYATALGMDPQPWKDADRIGR